MGLNSYTLDFTWDKFLDLWQYQPIQQRTPSFLYFNWSAFQLKKMRENFLECCKFFFKDNQCLNNGNFHGKKKKKEGD